MRDEYGGGNAAEVTDSLTTVEFSSLATLRGLRNSSPPLNPPVDGEK